MKILVTICARAGSKGVKNKNIRMFNGKPLVYYTLDALREFVSSINAETELAVNTDSMELVDQISEYGIHFMHIQREENLAGDKVGKVAVIQDTLKKMEKQSGNIYDVILDLDLTSPLRENGDIKGVVDALLANDKNDVAFSVVPSRRSPWFNMVKANEDGSCNLVIESNFLTRQDAPACYDMNASIYAYRRPFLMQDNTVKVLDGKAAFYVMKDYGILDIDSEEDYILMQKIKKMMEENDELK